MSDKPRKLLDTIFQNLPPNATLSQLFKAYQINLEILQAALKESYDEGYKSAELALKKRTIDK